jgi:hypothetical protein
VALGGRLAGGVPVPYELLDEMVVARTPSLSGCPVTELVVAGEVDPSVTAPVESAVFRRSSLHADARPLASRGVKGWPTSTAYGVRWLSDLTTSSESACPERDLNPHVLSNNGF